MPHLHLSMQAGDDLTLKRMKRRHLRADAIRFCSEARRLRPDVVFGADLIAGFPTETDAMFDNTLRLVDECELTYLHVFPFSPRQGTPAARMPQVEHAVVKDRAARLRAKGEATHAAYLERLKGRRSKYSWSARIWAAHRTSPEVRVAPNLPVGSFNWAVLGSHDGRRVDGMLVA